MSVCNYQVCTVEAGVRDEPCEPQVDLNSKKSGYEVEHFVHVLGWLHVLVVVHGNGDIDGDRVTVAYNIQHSAVSALKCSSR